MQYSKAAKSQIEKLKANHVKSMEQLASARSHYQSQITNLTEELKAKNDKIQSLRQQRNQARNQQDAFEKEMEKLKGKLHATVGKVSIANQERDDALKQAQASTLQLEELSRKSAVHETNIKALRQKLDGTRDQRAAYVEEAAKLNAKLKVAASRITMLSRERDEANAHSHTLMAQSEAQRVKFTQKCATQESEIKSLRWKYDSLHDECEQSRRRNRETDHKLKVALQGSAIADKELDEAKQSIESLTTRSLQQHAELSGKCTSQHAQLRTLSNELEEANRQLTRSRIKRGELQDQICDLEDASSEKGIRLKQSEALLQTAQAEVTQLSSDLNLKALNVNTLLEQLDQSKHRIEKLQDTEKEVNALREELSSLKAKPYPEARLSGDRDDAILAQDCMPQKPLDDDLNLRPSDLISVADTTQPPRPIYRFQRELQQFNVSLSDTAVNLSALAEPLHACARQQGATLSSAFGDDATRLDRALHVFSESLIQTILEKGQKREIEGPKIRPLARLLVQHSLTLWSSGILGGCDMRASSVDRTKATGELRLQQLPWSYVLLPRFQR